MSVVDTEVNQCKFSEPMWPDRLEAPCGRLVAGKKG